MLTRMRLLAALGAVFAAVVIMVSNPHPLPSPPMWHCAVPARRTRWPPPPSSGRYSRPPTLPFEPCRDLPIDVLDTIGLAFTPPEIETINRCKLDAGNYQMAVEAVVWRSFEQTLPPDAVELDIAGHRAAQYWIMKPTDWNNRWWFTCMVAFKTSYGLIQQSLFYSPSTPNRTSTAWRRTCAGPTNWPRTTSTDLPGAR